MNNLIAFTDEGGHHLREIKKCPACWGYNNPPEACECGGFIHQELEEETYSYEEDFLDVTYNYRCDRCNLIER